MPSTQIPAITDALVALWEADTDLAGVKIVEADADPTGKKWEAIVVGTGKVKREWRSLGNQPVPLNETFEILCEVRIIQPGARDWKTIRQRGYDIFEVAEAALRANHNLDGLILFCRVSEASHRFEATDKGRACAVRFTVEGKAHI